MTNGDICLTKVALYKKSIEIGLIQEAYILQDGSSRAGLW